MNLPSQVPYVNGIYYGASSTKPYSFAQSGMLSIPQQIAAGYLVPINGGNNSNTNNTNNYLNNAFSNASSGGVAGTLQPFVNRNTSLANNALYGGLLGYQPQQLKAGNAGGTPVDPQSPQYNMPSAFPQGLLSFGNRSWMGGQ